MLIRNHQKADAASEAVYSDCETYRYALTRLWGPGRRLAFVMLNPSTATEMQNDPTVERCERRARALGYGGFRVVNLFAYRATDPAQLRKVVDPVGPDNDATLTKAATWADTIICGWGMHGGLYERGAKIRTRLRASGKDLHHLGLTKDGQPRHPLYVAYAILPQIWTSP